jgi:hypothetical protein
MNHYRLRAYSIPRLSNLKGPPPFKDYLWMAYSNQTEWDEFKGIMDYRLSQCAKDSEELLHAAATKAVFFECGFFLISHRNPRPLGVVE